MVARNQIAFLLITLCMLLAGCAIFAAGSALADGMQDALGAAILAWIAQASLFLAVVSLVLLVMALSWDFIQDEGCPRGAQSDEPT